MNFIVVGFDRSTITKALQLADKYEQIYVAIGWHPADAHLCTEADWQWLCEQAKHPAVRAIGETGLDYYWQKQTSDVQKCLFWRHVQLAHELAKPLVIHNRDADFAMQPLLHDTRRQYASLRLILHSFSGDQTALAFYQTLDVYFSLSGVVTFSKAKKLREAVPSIPLDRLLLETDAPYLTPVPFRGRRNEPSYLPFIAQEVAKLYAKTETYIRERTTRNAQLIFAL